MTARNLEWLRPRVARLVNFNVSEPDEDFESEDSDRPWNLIDDAINEANELEHEFMVDNVALTQMQIVEELVWSANERTLALPVHLYQQNVLRVDDETAGAPGSPVQIWNRGQGYEPTVSWRDYRTLQWGTVGPGQDTTLAITYVPPAPLLEEEIDEPWTIPPRFRRVIVWSAGIILRLHAEDTAPQGWYGQREYWRERLVLAMSKGSPRETNWPQVRP